MKKIFLALTILTTGYTTAITEARADAHCNASIITASNVAHEMCSYFLGDAKLEGASCTQAFNQCIDFVQDRFQSTLEYHSLSQFNVFENYHNGTFHVNDVTKCNKVLMDDFKMASIYYDQDVGTDPISIFEEMETIRFNVATECGKKFRSSTQSTVEDVKISDLNSGNDAVDASEKAFVPLSAGSHSEISGGCALVASAPTNFSGVLGFFVSLLGLEVARRRLLHSKSARP